MVSNMFRFMSAEWMLQSGSSHAVLLGRTGRMAGFAEARAMSASMCSIEAMRCDVAIGCEGQAAATAASTAGWKPSGTLHAAGLQVRLH